MRIMLVAFSTAPANPHSKQRMPSFAKRIEKSFDSDTLSNMTALEKQVMNLSKPQKINLMEKIWTNLSQEGDGFEPPTWHASELEETERRVEGGKERFEDWSEAKRRLRES